MIGLLLSLFPLFVVFCAKNEKTKARAESSTSGNSENIVAPKPASKSKSTEIPTRSSAEKKSSEDLKKQELDQEKLKVKVLAELEELADWFKKHLPKCGFTEGKATCECLDLKRKVNAIVEKYCKKLKELPTSGGIPKEVEAKQAQLLEQVRVHAKLSKEWERELRSEKTQMSIKSSKKSREKTTERSKDTKSKDGKKRRKQKQEKSKQSDSGDKISKMSMAAPVDAVMGEYEALIDKEKAVTQETQDSDSA